MSENNEQTLTQRDHPRWDPVARLLTYRGQVCRKYSRSASNAECVYGAFQKAGWPLEIPNPFARESTSNHGEKKEDDTRLSQAIGDINRDIKHIRFGLSVDDKVTVAHWHIQQAEQEVSSEPGHLTGVASYYSNCWSRGDVMSRRR
jgi:hypothetical protein